MLDAVLPKCRVGNVQTGEKERLQTTLWVWDVLRISGLFNLRTHLSKISLQSEYRRLMLVLLNKDHSCGERGEGCDYRD